MRGQRQGRHICPVRWAASACRRALVVLMLAVGFLAALASVASAGVVYNRADDCIDSHPAGVSVVGTTADGGLQILADPADAGQARNLLLGLQSGPLAGLHNAFSADGGSGLLPAGADGGPYQLFVAPASDFARGNLGDTSEYCDADAVSAIALRDDLSDPLDVATHELGHAFTGGLLGQASHDTWFEEALSEYYAFTLAPDRALQRRRDAQLIGNPRVPLDTFNSSAAYDRAHEYSEDRFLQWLAQRLGPNFDAVAMQVLRDSGSTSDTAQHVDRDLKDALTIRGRTFADDLGEFWGDHLLPEGDQPFGGTGPQLDPRPDVFRDATDVTTDVHVRSLAADGTTIRLAAGVKQLILRIPSPEPHGRLWVSWPGHLEDDSDAGTDVHFCVGPVSSGAIAWPGDFRLVLSNTSNSTVAFPVQAKTLTDKCHRRPRRRPPPRRGRGCHARTPRLGFYSNAGADDTIVVNPTVDIYLMCQAGHRYVGSISGESSCDGTLLGQGFLLASPGAWVEHSSRGPGRLHGDGFGFDYRFEGAHERVTGTFGGGGVAGTVDYQNPGACSGAHLTQSFSLTWRSGLP
jgi:hypothetical protein